MKILKYALLAAGGAALLLAAVIAYVAATFNPNDYKPQLVQLVKEKNQRTLKLDGDIRLSFWPNVGAELGKVSLSEAKSEKEFAAIGGARVSVKLVPLFSARMVVDEVSVKGVRATIVRFKDGRMNIDDLAGKGDDKDKTQPVAFDIAQVVIEDSAFTYRDEAKGVQVALTKIRLKTGRLANGVPSKVEFSTLAQSNQPRLNLETDLKTRLTFDLDKEVYAFEDLVLEARGAAAGITNLKARATGGVTAKLKTGEFATDKLNVALTGNSGKDALDIKAEAPRLNITADKASGDKVAIVAKIAGPEGAASVSLNLPGIEGTAQSFKSGAMTLELDMKKGGLTVKAKLASPLSGNIKAQQLSLPQLKTSISASGPDVPGKNIVGELAGSASADLAKQSVQTSLAGKVADSSIKGQVGIADFSPLKLVFNVDIDQLDIDRYFPRQPEGQKQPEKPFDLSALKGLNATGTLRIGALKANNLKATNVRLDLKAANGRVELSPLTANFYQGTLSSAATINAAPAVPAFAVKHNMSGVSVGPLLKDLANNDTLEGRGNITIDVTSQGNTVAALKKALNGSAAIKLADGAVKGIDIAGSIRGAKAKLGQLRGEQTQAADKSQKTDFSELTGSFAIKNGVARNSDLSLKSPLLRVGGEGDINIGEDTINYLVKASVVGTTKGQGGRGTDDLKGLTVPVKVTGPLAAPSYKLDFSSMAADTAKQAVQGRLQGLLGGGAAKDAAKGDAAKKDAPASGGSTRDKLRGLFGR